MKTRKYLLMCLLVVGLGVLFAATQASANPNGVPVTEPGPLVCKTSGGNWQISAVLGNSGEFPFAVPCTAHPGKSCAEYKYSVSVLGKAGTPDHVLFAVSADQDLDSAKPSAFVTPPGPGDNVTGFLSQARHEYPIRVNPTPQAPVEIVVVGPSSARISTVLVKKGNTLESCLIAGPGVNVAPPGPLASQQCTAFDSRLFAKITRGPDGCQVNQAQFFLDSPTCSGTPLGGNFVAGPFPPAATDLYCASLDAKGCAECVKASKQPNSPITFEYTLPSGDTLVICYDPDQSDFVCR